MVPGAAAQALAARTEKDPRLVQLILDESACVLREKPGVLIVRPRLGHVGANAGIDQSNIEHDGGEAALLLPRDPDASAAALHAALRAATGRHVGVVIADSMNRPWRLGTVGGAIGCAGLEVLDDRRGQHDLFGRELKVTMINRADSIAALATLLMGESIEATPVALVRGFGVDAQGGARPTSSARWPTTSSADAMRTPAYLALTGGVGGAKLALGLSRVLAPEDLAFVVNTGDDFEHLGLHVSPDLDTLMYTLAGLANPETGWGRADESWHFIETLRGLGGAGWFNLGDRDLAVRNADHRAACRTVVVGGHRSALPEARHRAPRVADE